MENAQELQQLAQILKELNPTLWLAAVSRAEWAGGHQLGLAGMLFIVGIVGLIVGWWGKERSDDDFIILAPFFIGIAALILVIPVTVSGLEHFSNPEWYAVEELIKLSQTLR